METSSRRKACDLCFIKKIRCDGLKPTCSNCRLYKAPCNTTTVRRRAGTASHKASAAASFEDAQDHKRADSVEVRLARIEAKLDSLRDSTQSQGTTPSQLFQSDQAALRNEAAVSLDETLSQLGTPPSWAYPGRNYDELGVPPLTEVLPVVESYFRDYNPAVPLFHQPSFMRMLNDYYSQSGEKPRVVGAAINIVLAFGYRMNTSDTSSMFTYERVKKCIDNAQMALSELMVRNEDTLGIQVILGLVLLFQADPDQQPSAVLISTAVRLAHRLHLHSKTALSTFPPDEARHRRDIFWICYFLDKDISLRTQMPSLQMNSDVDIDLPGSDPGESDNYFQSIDGLSNLHYLRTRVKLANIQGRIYDSLFSNRSKKQSMDSRQRSVVYLDRLLDQWRMAIPASLQLECVTKSLKREPLVHMTSLYQTYMVCLALTHGLCSLDAPWLKSLGKLAALSLENFDNQTNTSMREQLPPLPYAWDKCVVAGRGCLKILSNEANLGGCHVWLNVCTYFCSFVFLLANISYSPSHELVEYDRDLVRTSMPQMERLLARHSAGHYRTLLMVLSGLENAANTATQGMQKSNNPAMWWATQVQSPPPSQYDSGLQEQQAVFDTVFHSDSVRNLI
ncbi:fungal-specific transcription factor domain-containing protein [Biscogniauxia marginata]|nr:fungal-specific transcription factor domain-containing protein [Biscogniauxia marginata]